MTHAFDSGSSPRPALLLKGQPCHPGFSKKIHVHGIDTKAMNLPTNVFEFFFSYEKCQHLELQTQATAPEEPVCYMKTAYGSV